MKKYLSLIKFSHTIFAMPFALIGFFLAKPHEFQWVILIYVILCMIFARSAAMAFNRYIDRDIDKKNPRTATVREIPSGKIKPSNALLFTIINALLFIITTYLINPICFKLSPIALIIILGYSITKRFTYLCHLFLGIGLALAPIGSFLAVSGKFDILPILFSVAVVFWVSGFDIIYALQDEEFDKNENLYSIPAMIGIKNSMIISKVLHFLTFITLLFAGLKYNFGTYYHIGFVIFSFLLVYQHLIIKPNNLSKINLAFFTTNGIASIIFASFVIVDILTL
tara:strand:- start:345 stop:1190 length:846 start_codon:yes stop_codon:yes gene_type:complete